VCVQQVNAYKNVLMTLIVDQENCVLLVPVRRGVQRTACVQAAPHVLTISARSLNAARIRTVLTRVNLFVLRTIPVLQTLTEPVRKLRIVKVMMVCVMLTSRTAATVIS